MAALADLAPQFAVAFAIIAVGLFVARFIINRGKDSDSDKKPVHTLENSADLMRQVNTLVAALTDKNGDPVSIQSDCLSPVICTERFSDIDKELKSHGKMHRKQFAAISALRAGQNEILDHLTNGGPRRTLETFPNNIDAADTGEYTVVDVEDPT